MGKRRFLLLIASVFVILFSMASAEEVKTVVNIDNDGIQRVNIAGDSYFYRPRHIVVKVNVPVELNVTKEKGLAPHDIVARSPEAGIEFSEELGSTPKTIKFTPTMTGSYPFYCDKKAPFSKSHRERGMEGVIEVVP
jgi:plastocyanin domain-containing protein